MRSPLLIDALLFQLGWGACVLGGNAGALVAVLLLVPLQLRWVGGSQTQWLRRLPIAAIGLALDLGWQAAGLLQFRDGIGGVPPWLVLLWLLFAGTLFHSLAWLRHHLLLAAVLGAVGGPASYLAGISLGAAHSNLPAWQLALIIAPAWAALLPLGLWLAHAAWPAPLPVRSQDSPP